MIFRKKEIEQGHFGPLWKETIGSKTQWMKIPWKRLRLQLVLIVGQN